MPRSELPEPEDDPKLPRQLMRAAQCCQFSEERGAPHHPRRYRIAESKVAPLYEIQMSPQVNFIMLAIRRRIFAVLLPEGLHDC